MLKPGGHFLCLEFSHIAFPGLKQLYDTYSFNVIPQIGRSGPTADLPAYLRRVSSMAQRDVLFFCAAG